MRKEERCFTFFGQKNEKMPEVIRVAVEQKEMYPQVMRCQMPKRHILAKKEGIRMFLCSTKAQSKEAALQRDANMESFVEEMRGKILHCRMPNG